MVGKKDTVMGRSPCHIIAGVFLLVFSPSESMHLFYILVSMISSVHIIVEYNVVPISVLTLHIQLLRSL